MSGRAIHYQKGMQVGQRINQISGNYVRLENFPARKNRWGPGPLYIIKEPDWREYNKKICGLPSKLIATKS